MAVWPASLPQKPLADGFSEQSAPNVVRTENDAGPTNARRRYTVPVKRLSVRFLMTSAQVATFETFHETTLASGVLPFDWTDPRTRSAESFCILGVGAYEVAGPGYWYVSLTLEQQL